MTVFEVLPAYGPVGGKIVLIWFSPTRRPVTWNVAVAVVEFTVTRVIGGPSITLPEVTVTAPVGVPAFPVTVIASISLWAGLRVKYAVPPAGLPLICAARSVEVRALPT